MVLNDQEKVLAEFYSTTDGKGLNISYSETKVLRRHLDRIRQMDKLAEKTYQAVRASPEFTSAANDNFSLTAFSI
jgi:hypothetical protein